MIEEGRQHNVPIENRICPLCKTDIENKFHLVMECTRLHNLRQHLFESLTEIVPAFANGFVHEVGNFSRNEDVIHLFPKVLIFCLKLITFNVNISGYF